jgi:short-subunit dehydrogenase
VHAAQRVTAGPVQHESVHSMRDTLQANAYFPALLTRLLLPGMLHRARAGSTSGTQDARHGGTTGVRRSCRVLFVSTLCPDRPSPQTSVFSATSALIASFAKVSPFSLYNKKAPYWH